MTLWPAWHAQVIIMFAITSTMYMYSLCR